MPPYNGRVSRRVNSSFFRGVASSEAELVLSPEGRFATLEQGGEVVCCRGSHRGGLERGGDCPAGPRGGPDGPYHRAGLWAECELGLFGPRRGLWVLLRESEPSSNHFFSFETEEDCRPWFVAVVGSDKVVGIVGPIVQVVFLRFLGRFSP